MIADWFAGRLRELRGAAGLSRQQLADKAGLKLNGIRDLEQGVNKPSWETVVALCRALNVGCDAFLQPPSPDLPAPAPGRPRKAVADAGGPEAGETAPEAARPQSRGRRPKESSTEEHDPKTAKMARRKRGD